MKESFNIVLFHEVKAMEHHETQKQPKWCRGDNGSKFLDFLKIIKYDPPQCKGCLGSLFNNKCPRFKKLTCIIFEQNDRCKSQPLIAIFPTSHGLMNGMSF
jgi:hypothetical protein